MSKSFIELDIATALLSHLGFPHPQICRRLAAGNCSSFTRVQWRNTGFSLRHKPEMEKSSTLRVKIGPNIA
jgi:hypothetical protein